MNLLGQPTCYTSTVTRHERQLQEAARRYRAAAAELGTARELLTKRVRAAAADDVRQVDILTAIGGVWTREHLRKLTRQEPQS